MGMRDIALPAANTKYNGNTSPITPYIIADKAEPPTEAEEIKPIIAPLFFSGSASISDALNMALPAVLRKAPMKANMHIVTNSVDKYAATKNISESEKLIAKVQ